MNYRPAYRSGRPRFPDIEEEIGEDPARFLAFTSALALARIRGIDHIDVARAFIEVEIELGKDRDGGPRSAIIGAVNQRIQYLREHGERDEQLQHRREIDLSKKADVVFVDSDGTEYTPEEWRSRSARSKLNRIRESSGDVATATDGGLEE